MDGKLPHLAHVIGVDFSGAAMSGRTAWISKTDKVRGKLILEVLQPLSIPAGSELREAVNQFLVRSIASSHSTLWGLDFPFGLPVELGLGNWSKQLAYIANQTGTAKDFGRHLVELSTSKGHAMHVRRDTDRETQTPFDCYHYRIIYQTFHGIRDVLLPVARDSDTSILPFQYQRFVNAKRWVVEACPSSTLKRLKLPYRLYKQSAGKSPTEGHRSVRKAIIDALTKKDGGPVVIKRAHRATMMDDPGGDAIDSLLAAVGSHHAFCHDDHQAIARHPRYRFEGRVFS